MGIQDIDETAPAFAALNPRHRDFVREYMTNGRRPIEAGLSVGYSKHGVKNQAYRVLHREDVQAAIAEFEMAAQRRAELTLDDIIQELRRIAFGGLSRFVSVTPDGDPYINLGKCAQEDLDLLSEIAVDDVVEGRDEDSRTIRRIKIKPMERIRALELLGKHLGLNDRAQAEQVDSLTQALRELAQRGSPMPIGRGKP